MIRNLVSSTPKTAVDKIGIDAYAQYGGFLVQPRSWSSPQKAVDCGSVWGMDNGCFKEYDPDAILNMLKKSQGIPNCLFAVVPDVVCDAQSTLILFNAWISTYQLYGYPPVWLLKTVSKRHASPGTQWQRYSSAATTPSNIRIS